MRILYCTDLILDDASAPSIHVRAICREFARAGHRVTLYAPRGKRTNAEYAEIRIPTPRRFLSVFYQPQLFLRLLARIAWERPDVLYVRHSHLLLVPSIVGFLTHVPVVLEINGILEQDALHINQTLRSHLLLSSGIFALFERMNARLSSLIIVVTDGIKEYFDTRYAIAREKMIVIPNGVDTDAFKPLTQGDARRALSLDQDAFYVGYIGSLHAWQGVHFLLEAAHLLHAETRIRFLIVGKGEEEGSMRSRITEFGISNVELRSAVSHADVPRVINACDVCINYPLKFRDGATSPFKVYEYLACEMPVISSNLASIRAEFGELLTYIEPESAPALAEAIRRAASDPHLRQRAEQARLFIREHSWTAVAEAILANMQNLLH